MPLEERFVSNGNVRLHVVLSGPAGGVPVLLLHGFPEFWYGWHKQIASLADAGFRVAAPDQRGYNLSSKPVPIPAYRVGELTSDVLAIADALGWQRFCLAGHDWGAAVAWDCALRYPDRIERLAILNVPHPAVFTRYLRSKPAQMRRSWYMLFLQIPGLPERLFSASNFSAGVKSLVETSLPGTFTPEDLDRYREAWREPHAVRTMINWYRALRYGSSAASSPIVRVPTRIVWGAKDRFILPSAAEDSRVLCEKGELILFNDLTHWLHHEAPERVNRSLTEWFGQVR